MGTTPAAVLATCSGRAGARLGRPVVRVASLGRVYRRTQAAEARPRQAASITAQPVNRPIFRCRPERVSGIPVALEMRPFIADMPVARFQESERPCFLRMSAPVFAEGSRTTGCGHGAGWAAALRGNRGDSATPALPPGGL